MNHIMMCIDPERDPYDCRGIDLIISIIPNTVYTVNLHQEIM